MTVYAAAEIHRLATTDLAMTEWSVNLDAGTGRIRVPLVAYDAIEATDKDAYAREALADYLTQHQVPEQDLLAGDHVVML